MREIDQIHNAEDQRQACRQQEQQHAKLDAIQKLLEEVEHGSTLLLRHLICSRLSRACTFCHSSEPDVETRRVDGRAKTAPATASSARPSPHRIKRDS